MDRPLFSDLLAERRRELGFSIGQASRVLRLKEEVLVAFEAGDFDKLPRGGLATGMLSSYARYLGLDAKEVVEAFQRDARAYDEGAVGRKSRDSASARVARKDRGEARTSRTRPRRRADAESFDTTRVRRRAGANNTERGARDRDTAQREPSSVRGRRYTAHAPSSSARSHGDSSTYGRDSDIRYRDPRDMGYEDDLHIGRAKQSYASASTRDGRRRASTRRSAQRPRATAGSSRERTGRGRQASARYGARTQRASTGDLSIRERLSGPLLGIVAAALVLTAVLAFSITSCIRQDSEAARTVPVSELQDSGDGGATAGQAQADKETDGEGTATSAATEQEDDLQEGMTQTKEGDEVRETSVSVSVQDGAVTWLEVDCDGESDVAETITGPWQHTYTVEEAITIQVGDTTAVNVVQNGRQVQFDSVTSGIGTIRIQGTKIHRDDETAAEQGSVAQDVATGLTDGSTYDPDEDSSSEESYDQADVAAQDQAY